MPVTAVTTWKKTPCCRFLHFRLSEKGTCEETLFLKHWIKLHSKKKCKALTEEQQGELQPRICSHLLGAARKRTISFPVAVLGHLSRQEIAFFSPVWSKRGGRVYCAAIVQQRLLKVPQTWASLVIKDDFSTRKNHQNPDNSVNINHLFRYCRFILIWS